MGWRLRTRRSPGVEVAAAASIAFGLTYLVSVGTDIGRDLDSYVGEHDAPGILEAACQAVVLAVNPVTVIAGVAVLSWAAARAGRALDGIRAVVVVLAAIASATGLKAVFRTLDPFDHEHARLLGAGFYPSGHAAATMALCLVALEVFARRRRDVSFAAWAITSVVGFATFADRDHHLSDVVGGFLLALAIAAVATVPARRDRRAAPADDAQERTADAGRGPGARFAVALGALTALVFLAEAGRLLSASSGQLSDLLVLLAAGAGLSVVACLVVARFSMLVGGR